MFGNLASFNYPWPFCWSIRTIWALSRLLLLFYRFFLLNFDKLDIIYIVFNVFSIDLALLSLSPGFTNVCRELRFKKLWPNPEGRDISLQSTYSLCGLRSYLKGESLAVFGKKIYLVSNTDPAILVLLEVARPPRSLNSSFLVFLLSKVGVTHF